MVRLTVKKNGGKFYICGGTLVASKYLNIYATTPKCLTLTLITRYIVTAAHCLFFDKDGGTTQPRAPSDVTVTLGEHDR